MNEKIKININSIENLSLLKPKPHRSLRTSNLQVASSTHTLTPRVRTRKPSHQPVFIFREISAKYRQILQRVRIKLKLTYAIKKATQQIEEQVIFYPSEISVFTPL